MGPKKSFKDIISETIIDDIDEENSNEYIKLLKDKVVITTTPVKIKIIFTCNFNTPMAFDMIEAYYSSQTQTIRSNNDINKYFEKLTNAFNKWVDEFQERGSGFVFDKIIQSEIKLYKVDYLKANSYIKTPFKSSNIINVKNINDNKCFLWSLLAKLYPVDDHKDRITKYKLHENKINMNGIEYPVKMKDIPTIEKQNNISINVFALNIPTDKSSLYPIYTSTTESETIIDLLYLEEEGNTHYCLIKNLDSFLCDKNKNKQYTCRNCLMGFRRETTLNTHKEKCLNYKHCTVKMPEKNTILKFKNHHFKSRLPIVIYSDFESNNIPISTSKPNPKDSYTNKIFKQEINSYGIYVKSDYPNIYESEYISYIGEDAKEKYVETIILIYNDIIHNLCHHEKAKHKLTTYQEKEYEQATNCYMCGVEFSEDNCKIREHNHYTSKYRGTACQSCNTKEGKSSKLIPVFFHNGSNYDFHFIIEELMKYENKYNKVKPLSKTSEEYISIDYGSAYKKLRFLDSYRFLQKGLSDITKSLNEFPILEKEFKKEGYKDNEIDLLKQKGYYPYEYVDSIKKLKEFGLPSNEKVIYRPTNKTIKVPKDHELYKISKYAHKWFNYRKVSPWFSTLKQEDITKEEMKHVNKVWEHYNCKTLQDYHELYLKTDVLLLADAFENFRKFFLKNHEIDPCYCFSAPGLTWQCGLKYTNVELELLSDYDMLLMFENGIRGGFSGVLGPRHVEAFNKYTPNYHGDGIRLIDKNELNETLEIIKNSRNLNEFLEEIFLLYLDANNLYGWAMSQPLPTKDFKWEKNSDYYLNIPKGRGCIIECDLEYTDKCKKKTFRYPLAPERMKVTKEELSPYQLELLEKEDRILGNEEKLFLTLKNKKKYIVHHSILKEYIKLGLKVTKVHRTISFEESAWLKKYINFNTEQRKKAKTDFEKDLWKLMNNAFYGKTMENIRGRNELKLSSDYNEIKKSINKPNLKNSIIFNENFVGIINNITSLKFDKPIYLGMCILDYSKLLMYKFYYGVVNKIWPENEIIASDTDCLFLSVKTKDIYEDMREIIDELDTSDYPKDHELQSNKNKKVIGKFKDELNGKIMNEIVFLRSKAYSFTLTDLSEEKKLKGIGKTTIKKDIKFNDYKNCLFNNEKQLNRMYTMNSENHNMYINEVNKISMTPFDDKRYICENGIDTLPFT